ncbi:MAG: c-type cytochrome [Verrucomicrobiota bacterium]
MAVLFALLLPSPWGKAQLSAEKSLATLKPAQGFAVSLWASEPMLANPTSMDIDSRGRVWIAEGLNYRLFAKPQEGLERAKDADKIKILRDSNGDGKADEVIVFADNIFPPPLGLAVEEIWKDGKYAGARVYLGNGSDLLVLEDSDGDDQVDRRYPLLSGFKGTDSDHGIHGMMLGPDGKLYFTVGDARYGSDHLKEGDASFDVTDKSGRRLQGTQRGSTLRVNLDGTGLEVLGFRQRNNYGTFADSFGKVFTSDNDDDGQRGCRMIWLMDGGNYGYRTPGSNRHSAEEMPGIIPKIVGTGNGAPAGLLVYEGDLFPDEYRGAVLQLDAGTHQVNFMPLQRKGAAFRGDYRVLLQGEDSWFRPADVAVAPDGSVFICDWYDAASGGNRFSDRDTGRIYRITYPAREKENKKEVKGNDFKTLSGLIEALKSPNVATRVVARKGLLEHGAAAHEQVMDLFVSGRPRERARALFVLAALPQSSKADLLSALKDDDARIRELALSILARDLNRVLLVGPESALNAEPPAIAVLDQILPLVKDPDAGVRRELILALRHVESEKSAAALLDLAEAWDGQDRYYLEALRAAFIDRQKHLLTDLFDRLGDRWRKSVLGQKSKKQAAYQSTALPPYYPVTTNDAFPRVDDPSPPATAGSKLIGLAWALGRVEALGSLREMLEEGESASLLRGVDLALDQIDSPEAGELLVARFFENPNSQRRCDILNMLGTKLNASWAAARDSEETGKMFETALSVKDLRVSAIDAIARSGISGFNDQLLLLVTADNEQESVRVAAIEALGRLQFEPLRPVLETLVNQCKGKTRAGALDFAALSALSRFSRDKQKPSLDSITGDQTYPLDFRRRAVQTLSASPAGAQILLGMQRSERLPEDLYKEVLALLHSHPDKGIRRKAEKEMPMPETGGAMSMEALSAALTAPADAKRGQEVFNRATACGICHRVQGVGNWVGPDLSTIGTKYGKRELLYHIINPSGTISYAYVSDVLSLSDGRILSGLIVSENKRQVVLKTAQGQRIEIAASEIEKKQAQTMSLMPEGLVAALSEQDLADLLEYLTTLRQPVSEVGQYYVLGPLAKGAYEGGGEIDLGAKVKGAEATEVSWRLLSANRENLLDLSASLGSELEREVFVFTPLVSDRVQKAKVIFTSIAPLALWHNGRQVKLNPLEAGIFKGLQQASLNLEAGKNRLVIRVGGGQSGTRLVTTLISDYPLQFDIK